MKVYAVGEPKFVGAIPQREPLLVGSASAKGWFIHETVGCVVVNRWGFGWRGILRRHWLQFHDFIVRRLEDCDR